MSGGGGAQVWRCDGRVSQWSIGEWVAVRVCLSRGRHFGKANEFVCVESSSDDCVCLAATPWIDVPPESSARYLHDGLQVWPMLRILMVILRVMGRFHNCTTA